MSFTNSQLAQQIANLISYWSAFNEEYKDWLGGTVDGGPSSDGNYPLTDYTGNEELVASPAKLADNVSGYVGLASASETAAAASAAAAATSESNASTSASTATAQAVLADADRVAAEAAEALAQSSATTANAQANLATDRAGYAEEWANSAYETLVSVAAGGNGVDEYSAKHWATIAENFSGSIDSNLYFKLADNEVVTGKATFQNVGGISIQDAPASEQADIYFETSTYYGTMMGDTGNNGMYFDQGGWMYVVGRDAYDTYVDSSNPSFGDSMSYTIGFINEGWNASLAEWGFYGDSLFQFGQYVIDGGWAVYVTETTANNWKYPMACNTSQQETVFAAYPMVIGNSGGAWSAGLVTKGATYATLSEDATDFNFALTGLTDLNFTGMTQVVMPRLNVTNGLTATATGTTPLSITRSGTANLTIGATGTGDLELTHSGSGDITIDGAVVSATLIGQWNTAYGWGDHASAGYASAASYLPLAGGTMTGGITGLTDSAMSAALGDRLSLYDNRLDATNMYGFGVESGTLYSKSVTNHRWYLNVNADGGTSDTMELNSSGLTVNGTVTASGLLSADGGINLNGQDINTESTYLDVIGTHASIAGVRLESAAGQVGYLYGDGTSIGLLTSGGAWAVAINNTTKAAGFYGNISTTGSVTGSNLNVSNWDTAYGWGDHASAGYQAALTYNQSGNWFGQHVPIVSASGVMEVGKYMDWHDTDAGVTDYDFRMTLSGGELTFSAGINVTGTVDATGGSSTNWNTAYGWGDHSGLYLPLTGGTITGNLAITGTVDGVDIANRSDLKILDNRAAGDVTPAASADTAVSFDFTDDIAGSPHTWDGVMTVKGWSGNYAAWQLIGSADSLGAGTNSLYFRAGSNATWGALRKVWDDSHFDIADYATLASPSFTGTLAAQTVDISTGINSPNYKLDAANGNGIRFWNSTSYRICMSSQADATWGGRIDTTSDYNMYFSMTGGTNRGFVFQSGLTEIFQIAPNGIYSNQDVIVGSDDDVRKASHGNYLYHHSSSYDNDQNGGITFSTSAPSGGTTGDIWFEYT